MKWTLKDRGFLPNADPLDKIPDRDFHIVQQAARDLPYLVDSGRFRETFSYHDEADLYPKKFNWSDFVESSNPRSIEYLFKVYSYFASAWVHSRDYRPHGSGQVINAAIARPLVRLSRILRRPPILAYQSYCLSNWRRIDPAGPIALGNLQLVQNFTCEAKRDEDWFVLVHVDIEARAGEALQALHALGNAGPFAWKDLDEGLARLHGSLVAINATMARMPEHCSPDVYFDKVRPYIFGFDKIVYNKCFDNEPQTYRGETGAQSSIVPAVIAGLGIRHKDSMLTKHLEDMTNYMPTEHQSFVKACSEQGGQTRLWIKDSRQKYLHDKYNACLDEVVKFRDTHFNYAVQYIEKKVDNPTGTGGTPYIKWLKELVEETKFFRIA